MRNIANKLHFGPYVAVFCHFLLYLEHSEKQNHNNRKNMKIRFLLCTNKYVFQVAGPACIGFDGYYTPYHVWRRKIPFVYSYLGLCNISVKTTEQDINEWIEWKEKQKH